MYKTIILNDDQQWLLTEAWRRMGMDSTPDLVFLGLGYPSQYKPVVKAGLMQSSFAETPKVLNWYKLTSDGEKIIKQMIRKHGCPRGGKDPKGFVPHKIKIKV
jgi:hypothetical protein